MSLKVRLLLGAAVPFVLCMPAFAQTTISTATTTPVTTSTTNQDLSIAAGGSVTLTSQAGATAVTVDSNNTVTNAGQISTNNSDNSTGLKINPNLTTSYTATGSIAMLEDYTRTDTNNDGNLDGALAIGTGRTGLLLAPGGAMAGSINIQSGGSVTVEGNNSLGVSLQSILNGNFTNKGAVTTTGSNNVALDMRQAVNGNVDIGGSVSATGQNSVAVKSLGDVSGEFLIDGAIFSTGFTSTTLSNYLAPTSTATAPIRNADDLLTGGPAVSLSGSLARGLLIQGAAVGTVVDTTTDVKDVIQNFNVNRTAAGITSLGSAPALLIAPENGAAGRNIQLGLVRESVPDTLDDDKDGNTTEIIGVFDYSYGLINRGAISASGLNKGFNSNAVRIAGSADGTHTTTIAGGIFNGGSIVATGFDASALGLNIGSGASTPQLVNSGSITTGISTRGTFSSVGVQIDAGASLPTVINTGSITSSVTGYNSDAIAFRDLSGTVTSFTNNSRVSAGFIDDDTTDTVTSGTGKATAIDLSHGSANVTLTQTDAVDNARITGAVMLGAGNDRFNLLSGEVTGDVSFGTGADTFLIDSAKLTGATTFSGSGANVTLSNGATMTGALSLGSAASNFALSGGSKYDGALTRASSGGSLALSLDNSTLNNRAAGTLNINTLQAANKSNIGFVINNARIVGNTPIFSVSGAANIAADTVFTPIFQDFTNQTFTLRVLNAGTLNLTGDPTTMLNAQRPYIYNISLARNGNALDLSMRVKTAAELGLNLRESSAYAGVLNLLSSNSTAGAAFSNISNGSVFTRAYSDVLPAPDSAVLQTLASNSTAAFGAMSRRLDLVTDRPSSPGGAWLEEFGVYHDASANADALGVSGGGYGVAAGLDLIHTGNTVLGTYFSLDSLKMEENGRTSAPLNVSHTTLGAYAGWKEGHLAVDAAGGVGMLKFTSNRSAVVDTLTDTLHAEWDAHAANAALRATYNIPLGFMQVKPYAGLDYFGLWQDGYKETSPATTATGLAITASKGDSHLGTAAYGIELGADFGSDETLRVRPLLSVGYRNVLTYQGSNASFGFAGGTSNFSLNAGHEPEDAVTAGIGFDINSEFLNIKIGYDAEIANDYSTHYGSITLRLAFW